LAVLVGPGEEEDILPALAHVPRQDVRRDRRVRVPEMRLGVHVVDRCGDVVGHPDRRLLAGVWAGGTPRACVPRVGSGRAPLAAVPGCGRWSVAMRRGIDRTARSPPCCGERSIDYAMT